MLKEGLNKILWAQKNMPVLLSIKEKFKKDKILKDIKISACLHVTSETANLVITLKEAGAEVALCASNPLSTKDDVAHALREEYGIKVFAKYGATKEE
ncbi:MAG: adenosylhomocysteinase, partial [candidate division WOR-3 bacterium]